MTAITVFVPADSAAIAVGADLVAAALHTAANGAVNVVRTGSRGLHWLEPLVEVAAPDGVRHGFGPLPAAEMAAVWPLLQAIAVGTQAPSHPRALGPVEALPQLAMQRRVSFARVGVVPPLDLEAYARTGGWRGLAKAFAAPTAIVDEVVASGLRGRGGAAFPAGIKWKTVAATAAGQKYVVCNADEGDSGTFADRMLLEGDPYLLIEGMIIAGLAVGASRGFVYVRSEYPRAIAVLAEAIERAKAAGFLGPTVAGQPFAFELELRVGAGSYVCGEETAMLESLEGKRGIVRAKPPLPAHVGLFGRPTVVNNVLTLAAVPSILADGAAAYAGFGVGRSRGTMPWQLAGNVLRGGLCEAPFGLTLRQLVFDWGGGTASGRPVKAIQVGGPLGAYIPPSQWDAPLDYEAFAAFGGVIGHGGVVVHDDRADLGALARFAMEFCAVESCGKCTPCRIGSTRGVEVIDRIRGQRHLPVVQAQQVELLRDLCDTMEAGSLCAMGGMTPFPVRSALALYPDDFGLPKAAAANPGAQS